MCKLKLKNLCVILVMTIPTSLQQTTFMRRYCQNVRPGQISVPGL